MMMMDDVTILRLTRQEAAKKVSRKGELESVASREKSHQQRLRQAGRVARDAMKQCVYLVLFGREGVWVIIWLLDWWDRGRPVDLTLKSILLI